MNLCYLLFHSSKSFNIKDTVSAKEMTFAAAEDNANLGIDQVMMSPLNCPAFEARIIHPQHNLQ